MENKSSLDRTQIIGIVLIAIVLFYFSFTSSDDVPQQEDVTTQEEVTTAPDPSASPVTTTTELQVADSTTVVEEAREAVEYTIENDLISMVITDEGAQIKSVRLKEYQNWDSTDLYLVDNSQAMVFNLGDWNSNGAWFDISERTANSLALTTQTPYGPLTLRWKLHQGEYQTDFSVSGQASQALALSFDWEQNTIKHEKSRTLENQKTQISYWEIQDAEREELSERGGDEEGASSLRWVAHQEQFFSTIITAEGRFDSAYMRSGEFESGPYIKALSSRVDVQEVNGNYGVNMNIYFGPNKFDILKKYDLGYDKIIDFGWGIFGWISRGVVVRIFTWLEGYGLGYGLIIFLMALGIKMVLSPLTFTSYRSMAKMRVLRPEIEELNEKFKDQDAMKKQQATMELYRKAGVNPLGGCIPQLLQIPILFAMFRFFPASIELRQQSFWWANDLSTYDSVAKLPFDIWMYGDHVSLFTILMAISTFMYSYMNQQMTAGSSSQMPQLKYIVYFMPVMLLFFFNSYPAALSYYYLVSNLITFGQQYAIRAFIDEDALHAKLQENKKNPKKQSKFQKRLSQAMEQQQDSQEGNRRMRRLNK